MTERQRVAALRRRILDVARLGAPVPAVDAALADLLSDALGELSRLAEIVDNARRAVGSEP